LRQRKERGREGREGKRRDGRKHPKINLWLRPCGDVMRLKSQELWLFVAVQMLG